MWMMGYNDGGEFNMSDAFNGRKLRPLMPRPATASAAAPTNPSPSLSRINGADHLINLNPHFVSAAMAEQNKRDFNTQQVVVSSRWNPTPEQLQTLEELYRRGTRTPSAEQIQQITAQLRRYGKIEGKNVFYWFQNHKARERQKRRRQLESASDDHPRNTENIERKESGASRTGLEVEHTKNWATSTHCSTVPEKTVAIQQQRAAKAAAVAECRAAGDGWLHFDDQDLQQRRRNGTWQMMHLSCSSPPTNLIINSHTGAAANPSSTTARTTTRTKMEKKLIKAQDLNVFITHFREDDDHHHLNHLIHVNGGDNHGREESQTLQLFPLTSCGDGDHGNITDEKEMQVSSSSMDTSNVTPYQFFEFLPLKN